MNLVRWVAPALPVVLTATAARLSWSPPPLRSRPPLSTSIRSSSIRQPSTASTTSPAGSPSSRRQHRPARPRRRVFGIVKEGTLTRTMRTARTSSIRQAPGHRGIGPTTRTTAATWAPFPSCCGVDYIHPTGAPLSVDVPLHRAARFRFARRLRTAIPRGCPLMRFAAWSLCDRLRRRSPDARSPGARPRRARAGSQPGGTRRRRMAGPGQGGARRPGRQPSC